MDTPPPPSSPTKDIRRPFSQNAEQAAQPWFTPKTKAIIWGMQTRAVQSMLDFDFVCSRKEGSVVAMVYPFTGDHKQKFYWGHKEVLIPEFKENLHLYSLSVMRSWKMGLFSVQSVAQSVQTLTSFICFFSMPSAKILVKSRQLVPDCFCVASVIAETSVAVQVGGIKPGCFKIGNTGGMMDNILASKLYRPGNVAYVSRSGGMSNELNNIISRSTNGVYEGVAIGGDRRVLVLPWRLLFGREKVYDGLVGAGVIVPMPEVPPPTVPMDYNWARELGLIRKPASFMTSICDERGQELLYAGIPITTVIEKDLGIGGVLSLLWFQRRLPQYACKFLEMVLMVTADHGPAVSGAHNTIVCARAGKDLISSLVSGLLTIGDRFGGALDAAAKQFSEAYDSRQIPMEFVNKPNLILNVDGLIGVAVVDLLRNVGCFTPEEAQEYIDMGALNGLFVLGRTIGFIGHYLDQKRLKQGLYRHPWDDISYVLPETDCQ
ncbi:ATP-citrate synthase, putative [Ixodes scapularis]|uniref:ATP-citrate synthase, putative n=1 Tax=Ixodes scapularis TaxID=6945 RepID=B7Q3D3_IXOSC|nr:ATP-citrate synthase, putative [Ixodes scapularis]|eukprot:XP_002411231.1 ATP-citrate synthase, putative [Ixodes scapularis]